MKRLLLGALGAAGAGCLAGATAAYRRDIAAARRRVATGSAVAETSSGPIEYADRGTGPVVLMVHGAGGGFDQGLFLAADLLEHGYRVVAVSRFGYLRTPMPGDASPEAQADAHAGLLDALGIDRVVAFGVSAGGPSTIQFCLRHRDRCRAMILMVPLAYSEQAGPADRLSRPAQFFLDRVTRSDFLMWAGTRVLRAKMVETVLGTPMKDVRAAPDDEQRQIFELLDLILPVSPRSRGLMHEGTIARGLTPLPLERISAPALIVSAENDGYRTYAGARYTAGRVPGARFIGYARGGHMLAGHRSDFKAELLEFIDALGPGEP
jgi:pimeloyl-ACP methyl ester carboxylesterase